MTKRRGAAVAAAAMLVLGTVGVDSQPARAPVGPLWFQRMDRNQDGDLTWKEFLGPRRVFEELDTDHDGLIDAKEAEKAHPLIRLSRVLDRLADELACGREGPAYSLVVNGNGLLAQSRRACVAAAVILTQVADRNLTHPLGWLSGNRRGPDGWRGGGIGNPGIASAWQGNTRDRAGDGELVQYGEALSA